MYQRVTETTIVSPQATTSAVKARPSAPLFVLAAPVAALAAFAVFGAIGSQIAQKAQFGSNQALAYPGGGGRSDLVRLCDDLQRLQTSCNNGSGSIVLTTRDISRLRLRATVVRAKMGDRPSSD